MTYWLAFNLLKKIVFFEKKTEKTGFFQGVEKNRFFLNTTNQKYYLNVDQT